LSTSFDEVLGKVTRDNLLEQTSCDDSDPEPPIRKISISILAESRPNTAPLFYKENLYSSAVKDRKVGKLIARDDKKVGSAKTVLKKVSG
jgi:hypothetical protein